MKIIYFIFGMLALILGVIGIFLPLLPTTPFLILAAICFDRGSPRFHSWILNHRIFGPPIRDWQARHAIQIKYKILATSMMAISVVFMVLSDRMPEVAKVVVVGVLILLAIFIWTRKS